MVKRVGRIASHVGWFVLVACGTSESSQELVEAVDAIEIDTADIVSDTGTGAAQIDVAVARVDTEASRIDGEPARVSTQLRTKLVELAVASECARREEVPVERAVPRLEALFATQGVSFAAYSAAMASLADDRELQATIEKKLGGCTALVAVLWPPIPDTKADVVEAERDVVEVERDVQVAEALRDTQEAGPDDASGPDDAIGSDVVELDTKPDKPAGPSWSGTWTGGLSGGANGNLRVTVSGRRVTGAVATFGRSVLRLKGSLSEKGSLTLGGTQGDEFLRVNGRVERGGQVISGNWDGVIDRKRISGRFRIAR